MPGYGYGHVSAKGFVAFGHDLADGAWKSVSIAKYDVESKELDAAALDASHPVIWKLRISWVLAALKQALGSGKLDQLDASWDACERRLHYRLAERADDKDPEIRAAAERLRGQLLEGNGTEQTGYGYDEEIDFGRKQLELAKEESIAADIKKLEVGDLLQDIAEATEALAQGSGRKAGSKRAGAPSAQLRDALAACTTAFNGVHDDLAWFLENTATGPVRDRLAELQAPFEALLARNPPTQAKGGQTPPAPVTPAAPVIPDGG
jgi:hypothetical protein